MARRSDHSREEIKQMAVSAAIDILNQQGVAGLSTRKVASAIGYTVGTLYLVFKNLDALILQVNAATLDDLHQAIIQAAKVDSDPTHALQSMASAYLCYAQQYSTRWSLLFSFRLPEGEPVPVWFDQKVSAVFDGVKQPLLQIRPELSEQAVLQATRELWSGVHGACDLGLSDKLSLGGEFQVEALISSLVDHYLLGFAHYQGA